MNELPNLALATRPAADACHPEKDQGSLGQRTNLTEETRPWGQHDQLEDDAARRARLVEVALPVAWHLAGRARRRLLERMVLGRRQRWPFHAFVCFVIVEPVLAGLETSYDCVAARFGMSACVLARRRVATADMTAARAAAQVEPPAAAGEAFGATIAAWRYGRVNSWICHAPQRTGKARILKRIFVMPNQNR